MLLVRHAEQTKEPPLSAYMAAPPPFQPWEGDVISPLLRSIAVIYCGVTARQNRWFLPPGREPRHLRHTGLRYADIYLPPPSSIVRRWHGSRCGVTLYVYIFALTMPTAQRGTSAAPCRSGYGDTVCRVLDSFRVGTGSYSQLACLRLPDVPFFASITSTWTFLLA